MTPDTIISTTLGGAITAVIFLVYNAFRLGKSTMTKDEIENYVKEKAPIIFQDNWEKKMSNEYSELNVKFPNMKRYDDLVAAVRDIPLTLKATFVTREELREFAVEMLKDVRKEFVTEEELEHSLLVQSNVDIGKYNEIQKAISDISAKFDKMSAGVELATKYMEAAEVEIMNLTCACAMLCREHNIPFSVRGKECENG